MTITTPYKRKLHQLFIIGLVASLAACGGGDKKHSSPSKHLMGGSIQEAPLNIASVVTTLAGAPLNSDADGVGSAARFGYPIGIFNDGTYLYVADTNNNAIRKIVIATGVVTTIVGNSDANADDTGAEASFSEPTGITSDGTNLYVTDSFNDAIRKIVIATGEVTTIAGGSWGYTDGTGTAAGFSEPTGITIDGANLYVADTNNSSIRKIVIATGEVTTIAGGLYGNTDGTGTAASFSQPTGITSDGTNLYVTDKYSHLIRKIVIATGVVTTIAGNSSEGNTNGTGTAASFNEPAGITNDGSNLYVTDANNHSIRKIVIATGAVTTIAGNGSVGSTNGTGTAASFDVPQGITTDGTNFYVADSGNNSIRKIVIATGAVTTLAGYGKYVSVDGTGTAASFMYPQGITSDGANLYVADTFNNSIRKIVIATGAVTTLAGSGLEGNTNGTGAAASFSYPVNITTDGTNLYVTDSGNNLIRKIVITTGAVTTLAGSGSEGNLDGIGSMASFNSPDGITTDGTNLYVADTWNDSIRKIVIATGVVTTIAGGSYGNTDGTGTAASFNAPIGITTDGTNLYVADSGNSSIRKIVINTGVVTTLAGGSYGDTNGTGTAASFYYPSGITSDGSNLYVADTSNHSIRKIVIATGAVTTIAGSSIGNSDGVGAAAKFGYPSAITTNGFELFVTDTLNSTIRKIH